MIILYREEKSLSADAIEAEFRELVLGYDRVVVNAAQAAELIGTLIQLAQREASLRHLATTDELTGACSV